MSRYIDADKLHEHITTNHCGECGIYNGEICCSCPMDKALNYIEDFPTASVAPRAEWISVEERLPEDVYGKGRERITVLVCTKSGKVSASTRCAKYSYDYKQNVWVRTGEFEWSGSKKVTHWMPLPEPPKGE